MYPFSPLMLVSERERETESERDTKLIKISKCNRIQNRPSKLWGLTLKFRSGYLLKNVIINKLRPETKVVT